jgi:hypothetical protein
VITGNGLPVVTASHVSTHVSSRIISELDFIQGGVSGVKLSKREGQDSRVETGALEEADGTMSLSCVCV